MRRPFRFSNASRFDIRVTPDEIRVPVVVPPRRPDSSVLSRGVSAYTEHYIEEMVNENRNTPVEIAIYQTTELLDRNGRIPETEVTQKVIDSFADNGNDVHVTRGLPTVDGIDNDNTYSTGCSGTSAMEPFRAYLENDAPVVAADSNILLMQREGGGCGSVGGNVCIVASRYIENIRPDEYVNNDAWSHHVYAALHEIGHNLGFYHGELCGSNGPNGGRGWNENGLWQRTPTMSCPGDTNACGETAPEKLNDGVMNHLYFHTCVFQEMSVVNKPPLPLGDPPTAQINWEPNVPTAGEPWQLIGEFSSPGSSDIVAYDWEFRGEAYQGANVTVTTPAGEHTATLTVTDANGLTATTSETITVQEAGGGGGGGGEPDTSSTPVVLAGGALFVLLLLGRPEEE